MDTNKAIRTRSIFIIEDDLSLAGLIKMKLNEEYEEVKTYSNGLEGFEAIKKEKPDVVVLDVMLPGMQGFTILEKIKDSVELQSIKVLLLTAKNRDEDVERGFELEANEYMSKPFKMKELLLRVEKMLN